MDDRAQDSMIVRPEKARTELLDYGLRDLLLNCRPLRSQGVEVVNERPLKGVGMQHTV